MGEWNNQRRREDDDEPEIRRRHNTGRWDKGRLDKQNGKGRFYIAQYPVRWTAQSTLHFLPSLTDLFIPTPTRLLREAF